MFLSGIYGLFFRKTNSNINLPLPQEKFLKSMLQGVFGPFSDIQKKHPECQQQGRYDRQQKNYGPIVSLGKG
jgi:hypothetical protein